MLFLNYELLLNSLLLHLTEDRGIPEEVCTTSPSMEKTKCTLEMTDLWKKFHELGTEMIITKSGRLVFLKLPQDFVHV